MLPGRPEARERFLCAFRVAKAAHAPKEVPLGDATLAFARRLVAVLCAVVQSTSSAKSHGRFDRADFIDIARDDEYQCPAGERAITAQPERNTECNCVFTGAVTVLGAP